MKRTFQSRVLFAALALSLSCTCAQADMKGDWIALAQTAIERAGQQPAAQSTRNALLVKEAIDRAGQVASFANGSANGTDASSTQRREASISIAAYAILEYLYPEQLPDLEVKLAVSLADLPENAAKAEGLVIGRRVAGEMLATKRNPSTDLAERAGFEPALGY